MGVSRSSTGAGHTTDGPEAVLNFCCTSISNKGSDVKFKDLDVDSLLVYIQIYSTPKIHSQTYRAHGQIDTCDG